MLLDNALSAMSAWVTYLIQVAFGYLVIWGLCAFVRNPRARQRMWGGFLSAAVLYWVALCAISAMHTTAGPVSGTAAASAILPPGWSWALPRTLLPRLGGLPTWATKFYVAVLVAFVLQLGIKAWRLRVLLSDGEAPSCELEQ